MSIHAVGKNFLINGAGITIQRLSTLGLLAIYSRFLSVEEYGLYALVQLYVLTISPLVISTTTGAIQRLSVEYNNSDRRILIGNVAILLFAAGTAFLMAVTLWGTPVIRIAFDVHSMNAIEMFLFGQYALYPFLFVSLHTSVFQAEGYPARIVRVQTIQGITLLSAGLYYVAIRNGGVEGAVQALVVGLWAVVPLIVWDLRGRIEVRPRAAMIKTIAAFSLPIVPHVALTLAQGSVDRVVLARFGGLEQVGIYAVALLFGMICGLVVSSYFAAFGPAIFRIYKDDGDRGGVLQVRERATRGLALVCLAFVGLALFANEAIRLLTDPAFYSAADLVPLVGAAFLARYLWLLFFYHIMHLKKTRLLPIISSVGLFITVGLALILVPRMGSSGAAVGLMGGFIAMAVLGGMVCHRHGFLDIISWWKASTLIAMAFTIVSVALAPDYPGSVLAITSKMLALTVYALITWSLGTLYTGNILAWWPERLGRPWLRDNRGSNR